MENMKQLIGLIVLAFFTVEANAQKTLSDITLLYDITIETKSNDPKIANMFNGATNTVYIKETSHRTESVNALGTSTTIYDGKTKTAAILKEYGKQKILVRLTSANWVDFNKKNEGIVFTKTTETKLIAGYNCIKSTGKSADGSALVVWSTTDLIAEIKDYNAQFKNVDGLVLQYEYTVRDTKVITTASKVITTTIAPSKFVVPKEGYREMTYEESLLK